MKVTHVSTSLNGGAGKAVIRLHEGLSNSAITSKVLSFNDYPSQPEVYNYTSLLSNKELFISEQKSLLFKVQKSLNKAKISISSTYFSLPNTSFKNVPSFSIIKEADILHLHWVANFIDLKSFLRKTSQPIVWTLHDMNPFSAGYHYKPTEAEIRANQAILDKLERQKLSYYQGKNIQFVYTSKHMGKLLANSKIGKAFQSHHIPLGLDTNTFSPKDTNFCKSVLGIPSNKKVVLVVGDDLKVIRKGFKFIKDCIPNLKYPKEDLIFCVLGNCDLSNFPKDFPILHLGYFNDELLMSIAYSAADIFITTAIQEAFGQTTIEALCCGKPVIGFPVGIIPEAIVPKQNGLLCHTYTGKALAKCLDQALQIEWNNGWIRENAIERYNLKSYAEAHANLYKTINNNA